MAGKRTNITKPVIAVAANDSRTVLNYRGGLIRALQKAGFKVVALATAGPEVERLREMGVDFLAVPMSPRGTSPPGDARTLAVYLKRLRALRPAAFLGFTVKPNVYGSIAAHILGIPVINNITGLGVVFARRTPLTEIVSLLYRAALRRSATVFFQNRDDLALFQRRGLVSPSQAVLLPGSGVDLSHFAPRPRKVKQPFTFLFAARLLWAKGVREYVEAARRIRSTNPDVQFEILGIVEPPGRTAVPQGDLRKWEAEGVIRYLGSASDVRDAFGGADCLVLPSYYREGVPRVLLEASAMAIPVITTDAPGCREAVDDGATGFLCEPRSVDSLVAAIERMLRIASTKRRTMGLAARSKMETEFKEEIVHRAYLDALAKLGIHGR